MENIAPEKWIDEYGDVLYSYAILRVNNPTNAEDLVQDTFLSALKGIDSFEGRSTIKTWLVSILKRKIIDHYRKKSTSHEKLTADLTSDYNSKISPFEKEGDITGGWKQDRMPQNWSSNTDEKIESEEFHKTLLKCLSFMPPKWAACFSMKIIEEDENDEICKNLEISTSNLWVILHRARLQLRECMEKNWMGV